MKKLAINLSILWLMIANVHCDQSIHGWTRPRYGCVENFNRPTTYWDVLVSDCMKHCEADAQCKAIEWTKPKDGDDQNGPAHWCTLGTVGIFDEALYRIPFNFTSPCYMEAGGYEYRILTSTKIGEKDLPNTWSGHPNGCHSNHYIGPRWFHTAADCVSWCANDMKCRSYKQKYIPGGIYCWKYAGMDRPDNTPFNPTTFNMPCDDLDENTAFFYIDKCTKKRFFEESGFPTDADLLKVNQLQPGETNRNVVDILKERMFHRGN